MGQSTDTWRKQAGMVPSSGQYAALNTVIFMGLLFIQFGLGMQINLFVGITRHHAGVGATNFFPGVFDSVSWAIVHGRIVLAIHAALGLAIIVGAIHNFFWNVRWGTRGTVWATGAALVLVLAAGFGGGAFLTYNKDVYSLLMALFFGAAMLCYAIVVYLLLRSPEAGKTLRSARSRSPGKGALTRAQASVMPREVWGIAKNAPGLAAEPERLILGTALATPSMSGSGEEGEANG